MTRYFLMLLTVLILSQASYSQQLKQTIRGIVLDKDSKSPIMGVSLVVLNSDPQIGTISDAKGAFRFKDLPVGRYDIKAFFLGFESVTVPNILLGVGKEVVLTIEMVESFLDLGEVEIKAQRKNGELNNELATISARSFTVEETKRFAGSASDPSRMAASYAGVTGDPSGDNSIVIRGNSPRGLLWRFEEIEIPNPNHFAEEGASGGAISILNSNVLDNSDFYTGAFPAEYGNAYSGVFDIKMRKGNNEKREYSLQAGLLGTDCSLEGPFKKGKQASYLINFRYSTLAILEGIGINVAGDAVPDFQDVAFNINIPTRKTGVFSLFGIGGMSTIDEAYEDEKNDFGTDMAVLGLKNIYFLNKKSYLKSTIAMTGSWNKWKYQEKDEMGSFSVKNREDFSYNTARISVNYNNKINARHLIRSGFIISHLKFDLFSDYFDEDEKKLIKDIDKDGSTQLTQGFINWKYRITEELSVISGIHYMYFHLNNNQNIEPRLGLKWQFMPKQAFSLGFGIHSKMEALSNYYAIRILDDGSTDQPNKDLEFSKANHYVLGYERIFSENLHIKIEFYYQDLYNVPVERDSLSAFSALNYDNGYTNDPMKNTGVGRNIGTEITLEKYYADQYFFMITTSLFDSKYRGSDGILRNTRYNSNYVFNILGGKEFNLGQNGSKRTLNVSVRGSWAGGLRYSPINLEESMEEGYTVRYQENLYSDQRPAFMRYDIKFSLRKEKKHTTRVWELDIQNVTNRLNTAGDYYSNHKQEIVEYSQLGIIPILSYRIEF
ncbi:carboxypeptidase regulatory-like domain-containing protein [Bacteroidota bacterium]